MSLYINEDDYDWDEEYPRKKAKARSKEKYMVCEGCEHPLFDYVNICPFCKAYRFSKDTSRVKAALENFKANFKEILDRETWY